MAKKEKVTPQKPGSEKEASMNESVLESAPPSENEQERIHVAGMGASAGGLEVFEEFFTHLPPRQWNSLCSDYPLKPKPYEHPAGPGEA